MPTADEYTMRCVTSFDEALGLPGDQTNSQINAQTNAHSNGAGRVGKRVHDAIRAQDDEGADVDDEGRSDDEGSAGDGSDDKGDGDDGDGEGDGTGDESGDDDADKGELSRESRRGSKPQAMDCSPIWCAAPT